jgi:hypothetical protein
VRSRFKLALTNATNRGDIFGAKFVVKYWYVKHENRKCCPQHEALNASSVGLAFSAITIAVYEPFLLPTAENWSPDRGYVLAPRSYSNSYRQTTMANGLGRQHGALNASSIRLHLARTGFKLWSAKKNDLIAAQKPNFPPFWPRNGSETAQKRL